MIRAGQIFSVNTIWSSAWQNLSITKTCLFKYTENFITKTWKFSDKNSNIFFLISAQNIDCGYSLEPPRRGGSNEYPQSMFLIRNKKNNVYSCKSQFYYIKVGLRGSKIIFVCFRDVHADSEDSDQTGWMPRLILVFAGRTCHFSGLSCTCSYFIDSW